MNLICGVLVMLGGPPPAGPVLPPVEVVVALRQTESADISLLRAMPALPGNSSFVMAWRNEEALDMPMPVGPFNSGNPSPKSYQMPKTEGKPMLFTIGLADQLERYAALLGKVGPGKEQYNRLWVDWNRDRKFAESEMLMPEMAGHGHDPSVQCFGPVEVPAGTGRPSKICFLLDANRILRTLPKEVRTGEMEVSGKTFKLVLVDTNLDGRYDARGGADVLLVDLNRDGKFEESDAYGFFMPQSEKQAEAMLLQNYVQLPDGAFYRAEVAEDGSTLTFRRDPAKEGRIVGLGAKSTLMLVYQGSLIRSTPQEGVVRLPEGSYRMMGATIAVAKGKEKPWTFSVYDYRGKGQLTIKPGEQKRLAYGLPLKLGIAARKHGKTYSIGLDLKDRTSASITDVRKPDGKMPKEPVLTLTDARGKVIKTEKFHYG